MKSGIRGGGHAAADSRVVVSTDMIERVSLTRSMDNLTHRVSLCVRVNGLHNW